MLSIAGEKGSQASFYTFICGISTGRDEMENIHLDIKRDAQKINAINISLDIDSLIWKTHRVCFNMSLKIHLLPYMKDKPPIGVHNHTYVFILRPQTDIEQINHITPDKDQYKLSSIPHTHFGQFGDGSGSGNVYMFFPRMIHRQHNTPYYATLMPNIVQEYWFQLVVQPALQRVSHKAIQEYVTFDKDDWARKGSGKHGHNGNKTSYGQTIPVNSQTLQNLQDEIRAIIQEDHVEDLTIFGSFFFCCGAQGCQALYKGN